MKRVAIFFSIFLRKELKKGAAILALAFLVSLLEIVGVAAMMPFFAIIGNPESIQRSRILQKLYVGFGFTSTQRFILALGIGVIVLILLSNLVKGISAYVNNKYIAEIRTSLQNRLLDTYVHQPYKYFLSKNSSELSKIIWSDTEFIISYAVTPFILVFTNFMLLLLVVTLIAVVQFKAAVLMISVISVFLLVFLFFMKRGKSNAAVERGEASKGSFIAVNEVLGGIKDVMVFQQERNFLDRFLVFAKRYNVLWARSMTIAMMPKFILETVAFGLLISVTLVIFYTYNDMGVVLPILGLYAFAAYKIIPAAQIIFQGLASVKQGWPSIMIVHNDLRSGTTGRKKDIHQSTGLRLHHQIELQGIGYSYPDTQRPVLSDINLSIPAKSTIGIVGGTGAGKTTL
ncbi:MAG: hypothetical protein JO301_11865, partial [Chitinophagaceae bacterium]|nr:hypothetical protein [Chitinophagaceae bacterium]